MKEKLKRLSGYGKLVFGYGIMGSLFSGMLMFIGYIFALIMGGKIAVVICEFLYKTVAPIMIYLATSMVLFGLICMYLANETALTSKKAKK